MLLLVIAVSVISFISYAVFSELYPTHEAVVDIVGRIESGDIVLEHRGGNQLNSDTEVFMTIAGYDDISFSLDEIDDNEKAQLINSDGSNAITNGFWEIGERLVYHDESIMVIDESGPKIEINIAEKIGNSLVLFGTLQEGYILEAKGAIWHFDECTGERASDSSVNDNIGYLRHFLPNANGPQWISEINGGKKNCSLFFDGVDDYVFVNHHRSLNMNNNITIEGWFKPDTGFIDNDLFDGHFGYVPNITHVFNNFYVVVYRDGSNPNTDGIIKTLKINEEGNILDPSYDKIIFDTSCNEPKVIRVSDTIVAVAYGDSGQNGIIKTYNVSDGNLSYTGNTLTFDTNCVELSISHVMDNIYAIAYGSFSGGTIKTFSIDPSDGSISYTNNYVDFDSRCEDPEIINVFDNKYVVAYRNINNWFLKSFNISNIGEINYTGYSLIFETINCDAPSIIGISDSTFALAYEKNGGWLKTFNISNSGKINYTGNFINFDSDTCHDPDINYLLDSIYCIAYEGKTSHIGKIACFNISASGSIEELSNEVYEDEHGYEPDVMVISEYAYIIVYRYKSPHPGGITSFRLSDIVSDPSRRGIYKSGEYGIFVNSTTIYGRINGVSVSGPVSSSNGWNHVVLIYDYNIDTGNGNIYLYCNTTLIDQDTSYNSLIPNTSNGLYIGYRYYGLIDEVAIYNKVLSNAQILNHYNNPGSLEIS